MKFIYPFLLTLFLSLPLSAQTDKNLDMLTGQSFLQGVRILNELVSIPNNSHYPEQLEDNIEWCEAQFGKRGFKTERLSTEKVPLLLLEKFIDQEAQTVLIYFHVDGQPVDPSKWHQENPYLPVLKRYDNGWHAIPMDTLENDYDPEWRIFGRSTSDDKGPLAMFLTAWDALMPTGQQPNYNIKIVLDFEEEIGSPNLPQAVLDHREKLQADMMLIMDGPRHQSNRPTLSFGARGISTLSLTVYGPRAAQHSGHYGNYAPNPALRLARLLSSMKDEDGRVTIPGFYDGISLSREETRILDQVPDDEEDIKAKLGISSTDKVGNSYQEAIQYPSLNIRGMSSGWVGQDARTIIPAEATAELDIRLVPESDPERLFALIKDHIIKQGYHITDKDPTEEDRMTFPKLIKWEGSISYQAFRTPFDSAPGIWLDRAFQRAFGQRPVKIRMGGGSIPISPFVDALNIPAVTVVTVNPDNNQHSPNENIRLGNFKEGIKTMLAILTEKL